MGSATFGDIIGSLVLSCFRISLIYWEKLYSLRVGVSEDWLNGRFHLLRLVVVYTLLPTFPIIHLGNKLLDTLNSDFNWKQLKAFSYKLRKPKYTVIRGQTPPKKNTIKKGLSLVFMLSEIKQNILYRHLLIQGRRSKVLEKSRHSKT